MEISMEIRKCDQCGGNLERLRIQKAWRCPFCGARFEEENRENKAASADYFGLNEEVFLLENDLSKVMKKAGGSGCIRSIVHCMNTFETAAQVEEYMLKKMPFSDDISMKGTREEQIEKAMGVLEQVMDADEHVIVYGNKGIFSKGKEYFAITDKRSVFVKKKDVKTVSHADVDSLKIEDCGNCYINGDYDQGIVNLDGNGKFQGAIIALICMLSFEAEPDRGLIRIVG